MAHSCSGNKIKFSVGSKQEEKCAVKKVHRMQPLTTNETTTSKRDEGKHQRGRTSKKEDLEEGRLQRGKISKREELEEQNLLRGKTCKREELDEGRRPRGKISKKDDIEKGKLRRRKTSSHSVNRKKLRSFKSCDGKLRLTTSRVLSNSNPHEGSSSINRSLSCHLEKTVTNRSFLRDILDADDSIFVSSDVGVVDVSGKSLTVLQKSLFAVPGVTQLDASTNMLQSIPADIRHFEGLILLDLSRNPLRHQTDFSGLPVELSRLPHLRILFLSECNLTSVPGKSWKCRRLQVLDIGRNRIKSISSEIGGLSELRYLNAQYTGVRSLPAEIAQCQEMRMIVLWGNPMDTLPRSLGYLEKLRHLLVNFHNFGSVVETHMIGLIRNGQLQSDHVPKVIFQLPSLEDLNLEETWINNLPEHGRANLKAFNISRNYFRSVPRIVFTMDRLAVLDISSNQIATLPPEIGQLRNLSTLLLSHNEIKAVLDELFRLERLQELDLGWNQIQTLSNNLGCLASLERLVLRNNRIQLLPHSIGNLTKLVTLDLSDNSLQCLPTSMYNMTSLTTAHSYKDLERIGLWLRNNPLMSPPENVWRSNDVTILSNYLRQLEIRSVTNLTNTKLIFLGREGCGKTSLVRCLTSLRPSLTGGTTSDSTAQAEVITWRTKNNVPFVIYDVSGADNYRTIRSLLLDRNATYAIVFDDSTFTVDGFEHSIGTFLDLVLSHAPDAIVKVIGTRCDLVSREQADADRLSVLELSRVHIQNRSIQLSKFRDNLTDDDLQVAEELKHLSSTLKTARNYEIKLSSDVAVVSSKSLNGISDLIAELESIAIGRSRSSPSSSVRSQELLDSWMQFGMVIKRRQKGIYMEMHEILKLAAETRAVNPTDIKTCLQFLSDIGMIFWFPHIRQAANLVFARCNAFLRALCQVFRSPLSSVWDYKPHDVFDVVGRLDEATFVEAKCLMFTNGSFTRPLLRALTFDLQAKDSHDRIVDVLEKLDLGYAPVYPFESPSSDQHLCLVIPSYNTEAAETEVEETYWCALPTDNCVEFHLIVEYTPLCPLDLFERLSCRIQSLVTKRIDWTDLIIAWVDSSTTLAVRKRTTSDSTVMQLIEIVVRGLDRIKIGDTFDRLTIELGQLHATYEGVHFTARRFTSSS